MNAINASSKNILIFFFKVYNFDNLCQNAITIFFPMWPYFRFNEKKNVFEQTNKTLNKSPITMCKIKKNNKNIALYAQALSPELHDPTEELKKQVSQEEKI